MLLSEPLKGKTSKAALLVTAPDHLDQSFIIYKAVMKGQGKYTYVEVMNEVRKEIPNIKQCTVSGRLSDLCNAGCIERGEARISTSVNAKGKPIKCQTYRVVSDFRTMTKAQREAAKKKVLTGAPKIELVKNSVARLQMMPGLTKAQALYIHDVCVELQAAITENKNSRGIDEFR